MTTLKTNITKLVAYAINVCEQHNYKGVNVQFTIDDKHKTIIKLFNVAKRRFENMPCECASFIAIHDNAKIAHQKLIDECYEFNVVNLINKFLSISPMFERRLKFVGTRENVVTEKRIIIDTPIEYVEPVGRKTRYIDSTNSGDDLQQIREHEMLLNSITL